MRNFVMAALPWVLAGLALALLAGSQRKKDEARGGRIALGASLGLLLGVALNGCGLWENHALGLALGPLWGMALASLFRDGEKSESDGEEKS